MNEHSLRFVMTPTGVPRDERLVIRCGADGEVWVSIDSPHVTGAGKPKAM